MRSKKACSAAKSIFAVFVMFLLAVTVATRRSTRPDEFKVLHTFHGKDGAIPYGLLGEGSRRKPVRHDDRGRERQGRCASAFSWAAVRRSS